MDTNWLLHTALVTYDDQMTNVDEMRKALDKAGFYLEGEPVYLK